MANHPKIVAMKNVILALLANRKMKLTDLTFIRRTMAEIEVYLSQETAILSQINLVSLEMPTYPSYENYSRPDEWISYAAKLADIKAKIDIEIKNAMLMSQLRRIQENGLYVEVIDGKDEWYEITAIQVVPHLGQCTNSPTCDDMINMCNENLFTVDDKYVFKCSIDGFQDIIYVEFSKIDV